MGRDVPAITINRRDRRAYRAKVRTCLDVLARMLREEKFDTGTQHVGLEIEFNLVDRRGFPAMTNAEVLAAISDPGWASELGKFNLELAVDPAEVTGGVFSALEGTLGGTIERARERAGPTGSRVVMVGILPSLRETDVGE